VYSTVLQVRPPTKVVVMIVKSLEMDEDLTSVRWCVSVGTTSVLRPRLFPPHSRNISDYLDLGNITYLSLYNSIGCSKILTECPRSYS